MTEVIVGTTVSLLGSVIVVTLGHLYARKKEIDAKWRDIRFEQYRDFLCATSDLTSGGHVERHMEADYRIGQALNMITLVGSPEVTKYTHQFFIVSTIRQLSKKQAETNITEQKRTYRELINAMRHDIGGHGYQLPTEVECGLYGGYTRSPPIDGEDGPS